MVTQGWRMKEFSHNLEQALIRKGWSQADLARQIWGTYTEKNGYEGAKNRDRISRYVRGQAFPDPQTLAQIASKLGVPIEDLAPAQVPASLQERAPQIAITQVAGYPDKVHLVIDALVPARVAARIYALMTETADNVSS